MNLDAKIKWLEHTKIKLAELRIHYRQIYGLMGRKSNVPNYNQVLKPIWVYKIQLWNCAAQWHIDSVLRNAVNAP